MSGIPYLKVAGKMWLQLQQSGLQCQVAVQKSKDSRSKKKELEKDVMIECMKVELCVGLCVGLCASLHCNMYTVSRGKHRMYIFIYLLIKDMQGNTKKEKK